MLNYFKDKPYITGCEVGVLYGHHANSVLKHFKNLRYYFLIDINIDNCIKNIKDKRAIFVKSDSLKAIDCIPMCDFIYLDGCHNYKHMIKEIPLYYNKTNFILGGHDFVANCEGKPCGVIPAKL